MAQQDPFIGKQIENYIVQERINRGMHSTIYRAFQTDLGRDVALKLTRIDSQQAQREDFLARFERSAAQIVALNDIHIVPLYDYGVVDDLMYLAMALEDQATLEDYLSRSEASDYAKVAHVISQLGRALDYAHRMGVYHNDLKPTSILMDDAENLYLGDFGLAKRVLGIEEINPRDPDAASSLQYLSPEQLRGEEIDERSNVFSLGIILYRMLANHLPLDPAENTLADIKRRHLDEPTPSPSRYNDSIPVDLIAVVEKATDKDARMRYRGPDTLLIALNQALDRLFENVHVPSISNINLESVGTPSAGEKSRESDFDARYLMPLSLGISGLLILGTLITFLILQPVPAATVIAGQSVAASSISPTERMVNNAQRTLEREGFIAYIGCDNDEPHHVARTERIQQQAQHYDLPLRLYDSAGSPPREQEQIRRAVSDGAALIMHCAVGSGAGEALAEAADASIPVVADGTFYAGDFPGVFVSGVDYTLGYRAGEAAGRYIDTQFGGNGQVLVLNAPDAEFVRERLTGIEDGLREIAPEEIGLSQLGEGEDAFLEAINATPLQPTVIIAIDADAAFEAVETLQQALFSTSELAVFAISNEELLADDLQNSAYVRSVIGTDAAAIADVMMNAAIYLLGGGTLPEQIVYDGSGISVAETR